VNRVILPAAKFFNPSLSAWRLSIDSCEGSSSPRGVGIVCEQPPDTIRQILALLESKPEVSSRELSAISLQYCARIAELRDAGAVISNRVEVQRSGVRHGYYKLVYRPPIIERVSNHERKPPSSAPGLFPDGELPKVETFQYPD